MSFSADLKTEILENKPMRARYKKAQAYGLFAFAKSFSASSVEFATENAETARLFIWFSQDFLGKNTEMISKEKSRNGKTLYTVRLATQSNCKRLLELFGHTDGTINTGLLSTQEHLCAFLSGAYLACGSVTDPYKGYHIEFVVRSEPLCNALKTLLDSVLPEVKKTVRRGNFVLYYKEYAQVEDLLTLMGASKSSLAMIDVEMLKGVRNSANRATNCETANIDKLVAAAVSQIEDIKLVLEKRGEESLPESLRTVAKLRLDNPEASLRELSELISPKISRSGIFHRLDKLSKIAGEIRIEMGKSK